MLTRYEEDGLINLALLDFSIAFSVTLSTFLDHGRPLMLVRVNRHLNVVVSSTALNGMTAVD